MIGVGVDEVVVYTTVAEDKDAGEACMWSSSLGLFR
jgi:hypothetical protein